MEMEYAKCKDSSSITLRRTVPFPTPLGPLRMIKSPFFMGITAYYIVNITTYISIIKISMVKINEIK